MLQCKENWAFVLLYSLTLFLLAAAFLMTEAAKPYFQSTGTNIIHISSVRAKQSEPLSEVS